MHRPLHSAPTFLALAAALAIAGCSAVKLPQPPVPVQTPAATVSSGVRTATSREAGRYLITVRLENPNDFPLPITRADYTLTVGQARYEGDLIPPATLPALGSVHIELPAVLVAGESSAATDAAYETSGTVQLYPPGEIRALMHDLGLPLPTASFSGAGPIAAIAAEPPAP